MIPKSCRTYPRHAPVDVSDDGPQATLARHLGGAQEPAEQHLVTHAQWLEAVAALRVAQEDLDLGAAEGEASLRRVR